MFCKGKMGSNAFLFVMANITAFNSFAIPLSKTNPLPENQRQYKLVSTLSIGSDFINAGQAQYLTLLPPFQNYYTKTDTNQVLAGVGGFIGIEKIISPKVTTQIGVSVYGDNKIVAKGDVWQFGVSDFSNFTYSYHVDSVRVMLTNKVLTNLSYSQKVHPFLIWEAGMAYNRSSSYQEEAKVDGAVPMTPFMNNAKSSFAWGLGAGFDVDLNPNMRIGIGYKFSDFGAASLGTSIAASTSQTLKISHLYANQLLFQFSLIA